MTIDLSAIRARCDRATAGPWVWRDNHLSGVDAKGRAKPVVWGECYSPGCTGASATDAGADNNDKPFLSAARTDLPALVDWCERAHSMLAAIDRRIPCSGGEDSITALLAEIKP